MASARLCLPSHVCARRRQGQRQGSRSHHSSVRALPTLHHRRESETRLQRVVARSMPDRDDHSKLFDSPVFRSELVMQELQKMAQETVSLSQLTAKFPEFDLTGKQIFLDKMDEVCGRYEVFIKRLELSQDPGAREFLRFTRAQMLEGGLTYNQMFAGFKQSVEDYRRWVRKEEQVAGDPIAHQKFLQDLRNVWDQSFLGRVDLTYLFNKVDPDVMLKAQTDPQFWVVLKEIASDPSAMSKWLDDPKLGPFVAALWKSMQGRS